jgi:hypothetical protein
VGDLSSRCDDGGDNDRLSETSIDARPPFILFCEVGINCSLLE